MVYKLETLGRQRYVGDVAQKIVHDRWNGGCDECVVEDLVQRGAAVGFEPDTLDSVFNEGFDYCDECFGRTDPEPPVTP
jgi:regulator of replication initiation timing